MKKKIIATSWHPGGANAILPVIKSLNKEGKVDIITIGHLSSKDIFENVKNYKTIKDYGLIDVSINSMSYLLQREMPDLVFTGTSAQDKDNKNVIEQTLTLAAETMNIKSLAVLDFWGNYSLRFSDSYTNKKFKFLPDKIAIMDRLAEEAMLMEGFDKERLIVTGNPYFDELIELKEKFKEKDRQEVRKDLGIDPDAYLLLYASQPIEYHYGGKLGYTEKTALEELLNSVNALNVREKPTVLVKVHPREEKKDLEKRTKEITIKDHLNIPIVVNKDYNIREVILASDAVISPFSTTLIESSYLDKPSISLQPGLKKEDILITNKLGITTPVYKVGEIKHILEKLLSNEDYVIELSQRRKDFCTDGKATERVKELVYNMIK